ncbi:MAG: twin arginine-targeting protein translocase TatC [Lentisphaerae bacterium RIFOXYB12_FULL_65_16]|nr:MAG: twin arginine-targeting protein translocase TatC [Lentisphaerae bacterium RIFOXYA12_64_32]OGV92345.1 MAG: twin arginine-targeting protein translocase TatC [Lentisphaerae bacterium RIFOXYB12_FULL_65_16]
MSFWDHLEELRWVILKSLGVLAVATGLGFTLTGTVYRALEWPLARVRDRVDLMYTTPMAGFLVQIKLALLAGAVIAAPFILGFAWSFVAPGLKSEERRVVWFGVGMGFVFFCAGVAFGYLLLPWGIAFLVSLGSQNIRQLWSVDGYISFCLQLLLGFGIVFQLPVVLTILLRLGLVQVQTLSKGRPYAVVLIFITSAVLTPTTDIITQAAMAVPLLILYETSILIGRWFERQQARTPD